MHQPPMATFTEAAQANPLGVLFDGRRRNDTDGTVVGWSCDFGEGSASEIGATVSHSQVPSPFWSASGGTSVSWFTTDLFSKVDVATTKISVGNSKRFETNESSAYLPRPAEIV